MGCLLVKPLCSPEYHDLADAVKLLQHRQVGFFYLDLDLTPAVADGVDWVKADVIPSRGLTAPLDREGVRAYNAVIDRPARHPDRSSKSHLLLAPKATVVPVRVYQV